MLNFFTAASIVLLFISCSNQVSEPLAKKTFRSDSLHFSIQYPNHWEVKEREGKIKTIGLFESLQSPEDAYQENIVIWREEIPIPIPDSLYAKAARAEIKITNPSLTLIEEQPRKIGNHLFYPFHFNFITKDSNAYTVYGYTTLQKTHGYNISATTAGDQAKFQQMVESILASFTHIP